MHSIRRRVVSLFCCTAEQIGKACSFGKPAPRGSLLHGNGGNLQLSQSCDNTQCPRFTNVRVWALVRFYVPNTCILGTRLVLPCKNGCSRFGGNNDLRVQLLPQIAQRWNCHTSKVDSCCAYRSGEILLLHRSVSLGLPTQFAHCCLVKQLCLPV